MSFFSQFSESEKRKISGTQTKLDCEIQSCNLIKMSLSRQNIEMKNPQIWSISTVDLINCKSLAVTPVILSFFCAFFHPVKIKL